MSRVWVADAPGMLKTVCREARYQPKMNEELLLCGFDSRPVRHLFLIIRMRIISENSFVSNCFNCTFCDLQLY